MKHKTLLSLSTLPVWIFTSLSLVATPSLAQQNLNAFTQLETTLSDMLYPIIGFMVLVIAIKYLYYAIKLGLGEDVYEKYPPIKPTPRPVRPVLTQEAEAEDYEKTLKLTVSTTSELAPSGLTIEDAAIRTLWDTFEEKLKIVQSHTQYSKEFTSYRTIESLQENMLSILTPYLKNTQAETDKKFYADIRSALLSTLQKSCDYLEGAHQDLSNIIKKDIQVNLLYVNGKLK